MWYIGVILLWCLFHGNDAYQEVLASSNACFSATDRTASNIFNAPQAGTIEGIKLVYKSGSISCSSSMYALNSKWGCNSLPSFYDIRVVLFHVIDSVNKYGEEYYPVNGQTVNLTNYRSHDSVGWTGLGTFPGSPTTFGYWLNNLNLDSPELAIIEPQYVVTAADEFMLQYTEAYVGRDQNGDNDGQTCAEVYFLYQDDCQQLNMIKHINWDELLNGNNNTKLMNNLPSANININFDKNTLTTSINIELEYLGLSYAEFDYEMIELGTTYVIDFESFDENIDSMDKPGTCQNRIYQSFTNINKTEWWSYSNFPSGINQLGSNEFLAYPPPSNYWTLSILNQCTPIIYSGIFSWNDLTKSCVDYDGNNLVNVVDSADKLLLLGTVYVNVISPYINTNNNDQYRKYQLIQQDFNIEIDKTINILSSTNTELFVMTVAGVGINREDIDDNNDKLEITLFTESADYLFLTDGILLLSPLSNINYIINLVTNNNQCSPPSRSYTCGQRWILQISNYSNQCPFDFSGLYTLQFNAKCNNNSNINNTNVCNTFFDENGGNDVILSSKLNFIDETCDDQIWNTSFTGNMKFYTDNTFLNEQTNSYIIGQPIYVQVTAQFADGTQTELYNIFQVDITNIYVCTSHSVNIIDSCLINNIDPDGPYIIINNQVSNSYYDAQIIPINNNNITNIKRFVFDAFDVARQRIYIHAQLTITLQQIPTRRRRQLLQVSTSTTVTTQIRDFIASTTIMNQNNIINITEYTKDSIDTAHYKTYQTSIKFNIFVIFIILYLH